MIFTKTHAESVIACPDSGSDDNIISRKLADHFGLQIVDVQHPAPSTFVLANGRTVSAVGQVNLKCAFRKELPDTPLMDCVFYVFQTLAVPMIIGIEFLQATKTLTKHRDRLVQELVPSMRALRVCSVGRSKRDVVCRLGNYVACATADTGSDLDLVSPEFASSRAFKVEDSCHELEFADGSIGYTMGMIRTAFSIGCVSDVEGFIPRSKEMPLEFFILENLNADILVGTDTVQDMQAFNDHDDCFVPAISRLRESDLNIIRYIGAVEKGLSKAWEVVRDSFTSSEKKKAAATSMSLMLAFRIQNAFTPADNISDQDNQRKRLQQHDQLLHDQLDNRSRLGPRNTTQGEGLPRNGPSFPSLQEPLGPELLESPLTSPPAMVDEPPELPRSPFYPCSSPENSTHDLVPRYFCPVQGCPRDGNGKGFKRQGEMIRHSLVHDSPGYVCPFCPETKHKYPRPDNLQRYVSSPQCQMLVAIA